MDKYHGSFSQRLALILSTILISSYAFGYGNYKDGELISLNGVVVETGPDYLVVESDNIDSRMTRFIVEMDGWNSNGQIFQRLNDQEVMVYGRVDNDALEDFTIEASKVYVPRWRKSFKANPVDEEINIGPFGHVNLIPDFPEKTSEIFTGEVITAGKKELLIRMDNEHAIVNTSMLDIPADAFERGDIVRVTGFLDENIFTYNEIEAETIIKY